MATAGTAPTELGDKRIRDLLMQYAVPAIIAMTASSLYNMVDSIYIGHIKDVGSYAISGLAVTFPLMNLATALGTLVGVGASTILSMLLGQKNYAVANKVLLNEVMLNVIIGGLFSVITLIFLDPILMFFGASQNTLPFARDYMVIILLGNVITHLYFGLNNMIRASGNPKLAMGLTIFTVVSNTIMDPIFIFVLDMGIKGAAIATVLCQLLALCYTLKYFFNQKNYLHLPKHIRDYRLEWRIAKDSLSIGMGPFLMGFNQGMQPIAGYNFGARKYTRVKRVFRLTVICATIVSCIGFFVSEFIPDIAVSLFTNDTELKELADKGLRIINLAFPLVGFQMVATNFFQSLGMVHKSILLSLSRQLLFLVPLIYFMPLFFGHKGVWMSFPIADSISIILSTVLLLALFRKFRMLKDGDDPSILGSKIKQA